MAWMPGAVKKPLPRPSGTRMARYDLCIVHTMVGSLAGTDGYFRGLTNGTNSHFGTGGGGEIWQWVDTAYRSGANGAGNHRAITIENADMGPGFPAWNTRDGNAVPAFTAQQIEAIARICAWAHTAHGVPLVAADTSRPSARGIGFHRLGVNPYRVADGELWSSSYGKSCPAPRRIAQIPQIIARAKQIVAPAPAPTPATPAPPKEATVLQNYLLKGRDTITLACPVGKASAVLERAWFSVIGPGTVRVFEQTDTGGIREWTWTPTAKNGLAERKITQVTDGATRLVVQYDFPVGGTLVLEGVAK